MAIKIAGVEVINDNRELILAQLAEINSSIDDTAVDVFIYDTSKDTDGGAWRHRTQHTSWYNEGASSTRGSRKEFPAVAVIVAETDKVTIYDGDDPSLPMWMVFNRGSSGIANFLLTNGNQTSVGAINASLFVASDNNYGGVQYLNFLSDHYGFYRHSASGLSPYNVSQRNIDTIYTSDNSLPNTVNQYINDVAMTVLPDAPTDPATGLPIPTIAVATDGGISVIRDDGTVVDYRDAATARIYNSVLFDNGYVFGRNQNSERYFGYSLGSVDKDAADVTVFRTGSTVGGYVGSAFLGTSGGQYSVASWGDGDHAIASVQGLTQTQQIKTPANGMVAYTTTSYNTGWMPGNIKLAALADTTAETLNGSELVPNGDFPTGLSDGDVGYDNGDGTVDGWTALNSSLSVASNGLRVTNTAAAQGQGRLAFSTVAGQVYTLSADVTLGTSSKAMLFIYNDPGTTNLASNTNIGSTGTYSLTFTASSTSTAVSLYNYSAVSGEYSDFDNVSVRLADPDRSVNNKGLAVHGSITKAPVATGADVVAYSGFSSSNYLEQPYNGDLNFGAYNPAVEGSGDFCVMLWFKGTDVYGVFATTGTTGSTQGFYCVVTGNAGAGKYEFRLGDGSGSNTYTSSISTTIDADVWTHVAFVVESGDVKIYENGSLFYGPTATTRSVAGGGPLTIGYRPWDNAQNYQGSLALLRISATAPTADQIAKIYEDEKVLFQENAKATLTGSSNAVTALAHDPDTDLLHVGTSGGRSVFQGLRRVEEHTGTDSQSLAAISAVDGLVVEGK